MSKAQKALYRQGVAWIAVNDEPTIFNIEEIENMISVLLLADLFGIPEVEVAHDIQEYRIELEERARNEEKRKETQK